MLNQHTYRRTHMSQYVLEAAKWLDFSFVSRLVSKTYTAFKDMIQSFKTAQKIRLTIKELNALSDAELRDIGINRGMIISVAYESYTGHHND
jgi:uncharacterized protein YjiS (DUF1127 family)